MKNYSNIKSLYLKKPIILLEFLLLISLPILLRFQLHKFLYLRHILFVFGIIYIFLISKTFNFNSLEKYGITTKNFIISSKKLISPTLFWIVVAFILGYININILIIPGLVQTIWIPAWANFVLYAIFSVPIQELIFRGFLINRIKLSTQNQNLIILYSSLAYGLSHLMFANIFFAILTTLASISWIKNFLKYQNLISIIIFHSILGFLSIYTNLFLVP